MHAERIAKASTDEAAKELLAKIEIVESVKPDAVRLETSAPKSFRRGGAEVKYSIKVPAGLAVHITNTNGDITLTGLANDIEATTTNGGVNGENLTGTVSATTTNGGVNLSLAKLGDGGITAETTNGGMSIEIPSDSKADVTAHVANGGLSVDNLKLETVGEQSRRHVEGTLNGGGAHIELSHDQRRDPSGREVTEDKSTRYHRLKRRAEIAGLLWGAAPADRRCSRPAPPAGWTRSPRACRAGHSTRKPPGWPCCCC